MRRNASARLVNSFFILGLLRISPPDYSLSARRFLSSDPDRGRHKATRVGNKAARGAVLQAKETDMTLDRRQFLRLAGLGGAVVVTGCARNPFTADADEFYF